MTLAVALVSILGIGIFGALALVLFAANILNTRPVDLDERDRIRRGLCPVPGCTVNHQRGES